MPCYHSGNLSICCPKTTTTRTKFYRRRWCFQCKQRRRFYEYLSYAEWYGHSAFLRCSQDPTGKRRHTNVFPGSLAIDAEIDDG